MNLVGASSGREIGSEREGERVMGGIEMTE
jgi:hypothetical protein